MTMQSRIVSYGNLHSSGGEPEFDPFAQTVYYEMFRGIAEAETVNSELDSDKDSRSPFRAET